MLSTFQPHLLLQAKTWFPSNEMQESPNLTNEPLCCISKQATNHADFFTLKIWDQSVHWLKSYGQKVVSDTNKLFGHNL